MRRASLGRRVALGLLLTGLHCLFNLLSDANAPETRRHNLRKSNAANERDGWLTRLFP
jgi:hypothetical protein